jgi:hypothetical protein
MYGWIWRHLPGPWPVRLVLSAIGLALVVVLLFAYVFPWLEPRLPFNGVSVQQGAGQVPAAVSPVWHAVFEGDGGAAG